MPALISPHGSDNLNPLYVEDSTTRDNLLQEAATLHNVTVSSATAGNAVMLGAGYFNPVS